MLAIPLEINRVLTLEIEVVVGQEISLGREITLAPMTDLVTERRDITPIRDISPEEVMKIATQTDLVKGEITSLAIRLKGEITLALQIDLATEEIPREAEMTINRKIIGVDPTRDRTRIGIPRETEIILVTQRDREITDLTLEAEIIAVLPTADLSPEEEITEARRDRDLDNSPEIGPTAEAEINLWKQEKSIPV